MRSDATLSPLVAMIALDAPAMPASEQVLPFFEGSWPGIAIAEASRASDMVVWTLGDCRGAAALANHPIPWEELEGPCAAAWWWPEAEQKLKRHKAHLLITLTGEGDLVHKTMRLTQLVASVAAGVRGALGIYWGSGTLVHSPEAFIEDAAQMQREELPLNLWVDFRPQRNADGTLSIFTTGLVGLGQMELEVAGSKGDPEEVMGRVVELAYLLVDQSRRPADGELVDIPPKPILVHHRPSLYARDQMVLRADL